MSNKLTFSEPGKAKITWRVLYNSEDVTKEVDSVTLNMNGKNVGLNPADEYQEFELSETTTVFCSADYDGMTATSDKLVAEFVPAPSPLYCGAVTMLTEGMYWETGESLKATLEYFVSSLTGEMVQELVADPIQANVAEPGKLMTLSGITPNDHKYYFYCANQSVPQSHPIVLYPTTYVAAGSIVDDLGSITIEDTCTTSMSGWLHQVIKLDGVDYHLYIQKSPNAQDVELDPEPVAITFKK